MKGFVHLVSLFILVLTGFESIAQTDSISVQSRQARIRFYGNVSESMSGEPLKGASISFSDLRLGAMTDSNGNFSFNNIPKGHHLVEVSYVGHGSHSEYIDIRSDQKKEFTLSVELIENNEVVVTGVSRATQIKIIPVPISIIRRDELLRNSSVNLIDAISRQPGVTQISSGQSISKPVIRGLGFNRVVVVNDGVRQEGQQWGDEHGIEVDEYSVNKVEILKGPGSLIYGSDAMAGVVNIITNVPAPEGTIKANIISNYQSNNRLRGVGANVSGNVNGFNWNAYGSYKAAADYKNKYDGPVYNSKFNEKNLGGYVGYNGKWGFSHLIISMYHLKTGLVEGERNENGEFIRELPDGTKVVATDADFHSIVPGIPYQDIHHFKVVSDNSFNLGEGRLTANLGWQRNQRIEYGNVEVPSEKELYFDLGTFTYNLSYSLKTKNDWNTSFGLSGLNQQNDNKGVEVLIPEYNMFDIGGYVYSRKNWKKFSVSGGMRYDHRSLSSKAFSDGSELKFEAFDKQFANVSGSAGVSYQPSSKVTLKFNAARGFRAPNIPELASNGAHEGSFRYEYGNRSLKSETSLQFDGGIEVDAEHVSFTANLFTNSVDNYIFYNRLQTASGADSTVELDGEFLPAFQYNQRKATLNGIELTLDLHPHPLDWLHFENSFSFVRGKFKESIEGSYNIPFIPAVRFLSELKGEFLTKGKFLRNLYVKVEMDHSFEQNHAFIAYDTETPTDSYTLFNAGFGTEIVAKNRPLFSLFVQAQNITDVAYQNHLSRLKYAPDNPATGRTGVYNMGRNFSIKLSVPLVYHLKS